MYGLPPNFDTSVFVGKTLQMICFNANQIYLHFASDLVLTIEGKFLHKKGAADQLAQALAVPITTSDLMLLLERSVSIASGSEDGTLTLVFDNRHILKCFDDRQYESYRIKNGDEEIII